MKILHIHRFGENGGAGGANSMRRLHHGLISSGLDSTIFSVTNAAVSPHLVVSEPSRHGKKWNEVMGKVTANYALEDIFNINAKRIRKHPEYKAADIIHLHRIPGVLSYLGIPALTMNKPAVFTICDMWAITGHCRYSLGCDKWEVGCGDCPNSHLPPIFKKDWTHVQWKLKKWVYRRSNLAIVAKSKWMASKLERSILSELPIHHIPNGVETKIFKPLKLNGFRTDHHIPKNKKIIMFAAMRQDNVFKGADLLIDALKMMPARVKRNIVLVTFGNKGYKIAGHFDVPFVDLGFINDDELKVQAYSAADLFVCPSRAENFGNVILESMACGTPVVAFRIGGNSDVVKMGDTGYLAEPNNRKDLAEAMTQMLNEDAQREQMGRNCRRLILDQYAIEIIVEKYTSIYHQITVNKPQRCKSRRASESRRKG